MSNLNDLDEYYDCYLPLLDFAWLFVIDWALFVIRIISIILIGSAWCQKAPQLTSYLISFLREMPWIIKQSKHLLGMLEEQRRMSAIIQVSNSLLRS